MGGLSPERPVPSPPPSGGSGRGSGRSFEERLDALANVALRVGVDFRHDGRLRLSGPIEAVDLMRRITVQAYELGASYVDVQFLDAHATLARARYARDETLDGFPQEHADLALRVAERGDASIRVVGADPDLMAEADPQRVARISRAASRALREVHDLAMASFMPWTIVPSAVPAWARKVFPGASEGEALERLWERIFDATRVDAPDPVAAWRDHARRLDALAARLTERGFAALHLRAPGTDLRLGLATDHVWEGASVTCGIDGRQTVPNIPTEEVFTAPLAWLADGTVRGTKPLVRGGQLVEDFWFTFEGGRVVDAGAGRGGDVLDAILDTDEGARRLGEIALVPHTNPIGRSGVLFFDTLFDENAASHLALGGAYTTSVQGGARLTPAARDLAGLNRSLVHVDVMVGSAEMDVDGIERHGGVTPIMRGGAWVVDDATGAGDRASASD